MRAPTHALSQAILPPVEISEILEHIPHRYPFLLIDRMEACLPNEWVKVIKNVSANERFFAHVPPSKRVMPQALILEALAQAAGVLCHFSGMMSAGGRSIIFFAGVERCVFRGSVVPGDTLELACTLKRAMRGVAKLSGTAKVAGRVVMESELTAVIRDLDSQLGARRAP